jgi:hypothetical protein
MSHYDIGWTGLSTASRWRSATNRQLQRHQAGRPKERVAGYPMDHRGRPARRRRRLAGFHGRHRLGRIRLHACRQALQPV